MNINSSLINICCLSCIQYSFLRLGRLSHSPVYGDSSTKNMINHLTLYYGVTKDHPLGRYQFSTAASDSQIVATFGQTLSP